MSRFCYDLQSSMKGSKYMSQIKVFSIYPSEPNAIGATIEAAIKDVQNSNIDITPWPALDIPGRFIVEGVLEEIDSSDYLLADITKLNFNVLFEIG